MTWFWVTVYVIHFLGMPALPLRYQSSLWWLASFGFALLVGLIWFVAIRRLANPAVVTTPEAKALQHRDRWAIKLWIVLYASDLLRVILWQVLGDGIINAVIRWSIVAVLIVWAWQDARVERQRHVEIPWHEEK